MMIKDYIFNLIINKSDKISQNLYSVLKRLEFDYTQELLQTFKKDKILMLKNIMFVLYELEKEQFSNVLLNVKREQLINLYNICIAHNNTNFIAYFKRAVINEFA